MNTREISLLRFRYPIGSNNDPQNKSGLTHFMEHCLLKAQVKDESLIEMCTKYGATINASTSFNELKIEINVLNQYVSEILSKYSNFVDNLYSEIILDDFFIKNEKEVIINEMETKSNNLKGELGNEILGYKSSLHEITREDIRNFLEIFQQLRPKIEVLQILAEKKSVIESIINNLIKGKLISLNDDIINDFYLLVYQMFCECNEKLPKTLWVRNIKYIKFDYEIITFIKSISIEQLKYYMKVNSQQIKQYCFLEKYSDSMFETLLKQLISTLQADTSIVITVGSREEINIVKFAKINDINYCFVKSTDNHISFISVAIRTSNLIKESMQSISEAIGKYLLSSKREINIKVNFEIGIINFYISGIEENLLYTFKLLLSINEGNIMNYFSDNSKTPTHILQKLHTDILNLRCDNQELSQESSIIEELSIVTNICGVSELEKVLCETKISKVTTDGNKQKNTIFNLNKYNSENEYIEVWEGPSYFSEEKYLSHMIWTLLDGTTGGLYKKMSLENSYFYSYKYFPREFYDYGYCALYVYTKNKGYKGIIHNLFIDLLKELYTELNENDFEVAKVKLILAKKSNTASYQVYINLASHILFRSEVESFFEYENQINSITKVDLKEYIGKIIGRNSIVLT